MVLAAIFFCAAFALGWSRAARRSGTRADKIQFGLSHGIPAALLGLLVSVIWVNLGI